MLLIKKISFSLVAFVLVALVHGAVDKKLPEPSVLELRNKLKSEDAEESVVDFATGAKLLYKSMYTKDFQVRCIAYAHLFKLISRSQADAQKPLLSKEIIDALVIVADADRKMYYNLFMKHQRELTPQFFLEAIERLEKSDNRDSLTSSTLNELIHCSSVYFPKSAKSKSTASPENQLDWERAARRPVDRLRLKFEQGASNFTDEHDVAEARAKLYNFNSKVLGTLDEKGEQNVEPIQEEKIIEKVENRPLASGPIPEPEKSSKLREEMVLTRLKWIDMLTGYSKIKPVELDLSKAFEFDQAWKEIKQMQEEFIGTQLGDRIQRFLKNPRNQAAAKRMGRVVENFGKLMVALDDLADAVKARSSTSWPELRVKYDQAIDLLEKVDPAFDTSNVFRNMALDYKKEQRKYDVLNAFTEFDM